MNIWGLIIGGAAGLAVGGPIGALLGAAAGVWLLNIKFAAAATLIKPEKWPLP